MGFMQVLGSYSDPHKYLIASLILALGAVTMGSIDVSSVFSYYYSQSRFPMPEQV